MGWKSASAHFQQQLAHTVLSGLLYSECELYVDDILAFASSEEELLERLRRLFERFRKYNVTLNPDKCEIGLDRVEYVGHLINAEGMHFTRTKLDSVVNFAEPTTLFGVNHFTERLRCSRLRYSRHLLSPEELDRQVSDAVLLRCTAGRRSAPQERALPITVSEHTCTL
jgi:hypothetical protein